MKAEIVSQRPRVCAASLVATYFIRDPKLKRTIRSLGEDYPKGTFQRKDILTEKIKKAFVPGTGIYM